MCCWYRNRNRNRNFAVAATKTNGQKFDPESREKPLQGFLFCKKQDGGFAKHGRESECPVRLCCPAAEAVAFSNGTTRSE